MKNNSKFSTYLFNIFWCLPVWISAYFLISLLEIVNPLFLVIFAFCLFIADVRHTSEIEILTDRIKKLEESQAQK